MRPRLGLQNCPSSWGNSFWRALGVLLEGTGSHSCNDTWQSGAGLGVQDHASGGLHAFGALAVSLGAAFGLGVEISDFMIPGVMQTRIPFCFQVDLLIEIKCQVKRDAWRR